jgi:hypothetical protein
VEPSVDSAPVQRPLLLFVACVLLALAGCGSTKTVTKTVTVQATAKSGAGPPGQQVQFGHVRSLQLKDGRYVMRFDPEWFLSGVTANTAAAEDKVVPPGEPVPNDNYRVEDGHRLFTYLVPRDAHVTVLTKGSSLDGTPITVAQLAQIVAGTPPVPLFEPISTGFWIQIDIDTVRSIKQQYLP